ncbi:hypothetical protein JHB64_03245 [Lacticaseibacillus rhamnosus]|uniref:Uncharacterized protein n=1 Tax=Lacticaseibacillus rhamnosus TaxID=47715 RepID=A0AB74IFZ6_LACRH|nr:hypothetical protein [Lacticaseibacillus rhamnosus]AGP73724.1 hypothetical protein LOCK908_1082 [Lacticaseibacillus rhamnosus LOCK908]KMO64190.1 hypothetical protein PY99_07800 [Lacticaseibacillus rhamnosus]KRK31955.1 hypothetical protein Q777_GL001438 [Lacticaseibacillus rhamnosus DSM 20021 = JCM 1136 = NBRC 3425]MCT3155046.1 hypothetical protein [Lacticaseibacillus rhamnosus]MCT3187287.1 hypothetical protein [Lacticaseibacillus rhamnosus]
MAQRVSTKFGWQWHDYVQADADCDRYWAAKKAEKRSLIEATKKSSRAATQGEKKTSEKIYIDF